MIKAKPLALAQKLKNIVDICEAAEAEIESQKLIQKGALDAGKENDGIEPAVVRKIIARRKKLAKDPAETTRLEDLMTDYQFMLGEGREAARPWTQADDELSRVLALTNTTKPPKIEAIKKALGCSQGKAHKLRTMAAVRLAKSSSSSTQSEHEHLPDHDDDGIIESCGGVESRHAATNPSGQLVTGLNGEASAPNTGDTLRDRPAGVAPGPHDTITESAPLGIGSIVQSPIDALGPVPPHPQPAPESGVGTGTHSNEAPRPPSVGAGLTPLATKMLGVFPKAGDVNDQNDGDSGRSAAVRVGDPPQSGGVLLDSASVHAGECAASPQAAATADTSAHQGASQPTGTPGASVSVGAVASESERVAPTYPDEDPGPPPAFLRRTPAQGRAGT